MKKIIIITIALTLSFFIPLYILTYTFIFLYLTMIYFEHKNKTIPYLKNAIYIFLFILLIHTIIERYKSYEHMSNQVLC